MLEDEVGSRFALHVEVKQPTDRFDPAIEQAKRYKMRAECWAGNAPPTIPAHSQACTLLLCSAAKLGVFANELRPFDVVLTIEEIARSFPNATPSLSPIAVELQASRFSSGQRVIHAKFGDGTVLRVDGDKLEIEFDSVGQKAILEIFVMAA